MLKRREKGRLQAGPGGRGNDKAAWALALNVLSSHLLLKPNAPEQVWALVQLEAPYAPEKKTARFPDSRSAENRPSTKARVRRLRVVLMPGVARILSVLGCDEGIVPEPAQGTVTLDLPDMYERERRILAVELGVDPLPHSRPCLLEVTAVYEDVARGATITSTARVRVPVAQGPEELYRPDPHVRKVVEITRAETARNRALALLKQGDVERACAVLRERLEALQRLESASDPDMSREIRSLERVLLQALAYASPSARATSTATTLLASSKGDRPPTTIS